MALRYVLHHACVDIDERSEVLPPKLAQLYEVIVQRGVAQAFK